MKKLIALLTALMLLSLPVTGVAQGSDSLFDMLWAAEDWSFLVEWGVLTAEEAKLLSAERNAVENGRELVRAATVTMAEDVPAALLSRATFISRTQRNETSLACLLDGEESARIALGVADGLYVLDGSFLQQPVGIALPDLEDLPGKLITAAQDNGWITRKQAMEMGMNLAAMPDALLSLIADPPQAGQLDTTAWAEAVAKIDARKDYNPVEGFFALPESADCDPAARCWYLEITPRDVRDLIVAALTVMRDNTFIGDAVDKLVNAASPSAYMGRRVTFNDAFISTLLEELENADALMPVMLCLTGYEDEAGELVRLEILVLDSESTGISIAAGGESAPVIASDAAQEVPAMMFVACYQRCTTTMGITHEVLFGDDKLEAFVEYNVMMPHNTNALMYTHDRILYAGSIREDGSLTKDYAASFGCVVNDTFTGLKSVSMQLSLLSRAPGATEYTQTDYTLDVDVHEAGFSGHAGEGATIRCYVMRRIGNRELASALYTVSFEQNGDDLTGTERYTMSREGDTILAYEAELYTQQPEGSVFDREAIRLVALSREQLAAWAADVTVQARTWWDGIASGFPMEDEEPTQVDMGGEEQLSWQIEMLPLGSTLGYEYEWTLIGGADVLRIDEEYIQPEPDEHGLIRPGDSTQMALRLTGLQEGTATLHMTWRCTIPGRENEAGEWDFRLTVDAEGVVRLLCEY